jgi:hypothetical protein
MRLLILAALCVAAYASTVCAQTPQPNLDQLSASQPIHGSASSPDEDKGQPSPQGPTGPLTTGSSGNDGRQSTRRDSAKHAGCS